VPDSEADTGEVPLPPAAAPAQPPLTGDEPTTVLRLPAELRETAPPVVPGRVDPRSALRAAGAAQPPIPPRPATPPPGAPARPVRSAEAAPQDAVPVPAPEDETAIIPKIIIIDDGTTIDTLPNTVGRRRT
jgi:hypothetical protein